MPHPPTSETGLSLDDLQRLTLFKWRYSLQARGFAEEQVAQLLFLKWRWATRRVAA